MKTLKAILTITLLCQFSTLCMSQTTKTIDSLETKCQECLDRGEFMLGCSEMFYYQMDSILNIRYKLLRSRSNATQKSNLKTEQLKWLAKRDKQFAINKQKVHKQAVIDEMDGGQDEMMILTQKNADFIKARVIELLKKTPDDYN